MAAARAQEFGAGECERGECGRVRASVGESGRMPQSPPTRQRRCNCDSTLDSGGNPITASPCRQGWREQTIKTYLPRLPVDEAFKLEMKLVSVGVLHLIRVVTFKILFK